MLRLLEATPNKALRWDTFRILDLYYLFPHLLGPARLPQKLLSAKRRYAKSDSRYNKVPSPRIFIQQLTGLHELIARSLIGKGFLEADAFEKFTLLRTEIEIPKHLIDAFDQGADKNLVDFLATEVAAIPLNGIDGLKDRTGLLEHRYDAT